MKASIIQVGILGLKKTIAKYGSWLKLAILLAIDKKFED